MSVQDVSQLDAHAGCGFGVLWGLHYRYATVDLVPTFRPQHLLLLWVVIMGKPDNNVRWLTEDDVLQRR